MNDFVRLSLLSGALAALLLPAPLLAQQSAPTPAPTAPALTAPAPAAPAPAPAMPAGTVLTEGDAIAAALRRSPALRLAALDLASARQTVVAEEGRYPFVAIFSGGVNHTENPRLGGDGSVSVSGQHIYQVGATLRRTFPTGTLAELRLEGNRFQPSGGLFAQVPGQLSFGTQGYSGAARVSVTQPLLRGAGVRVGEAELRAARASRRLAEKSHERAASALLRDVLTAYWELWFADRSLDIERAALQFAQRQLAEAELRASAGTLAPPDLLPFLTRVASLEESVVAADQLRRQRALALAETLGSDDMELHAAPAAPPPEAPLPPEAVERVLRADSPEVLVSEEQAQVARVRAEVAGESLRKRLDLQAWGETQGIGPQVPAALSGTARLSAVSFFAGLTLELPLDGSREQAERTRALLAVQTAEQQVRVARLRARAEALRLVEGESAARRRFALAERTEAIAKRSFDAESARFQLGSSLPLQVQQAEEELRRARLRVVRARVDQIVASFALSHLSGDLLARHATSLRPQ